MGPYSKIAEGLAAWLSFERRCGRENLFSEKSLAHPLGDLLQYRFPGRVRAEVEHPVLAQLHTGVGKKPRVDFAVDGPEGIYALVVEAKWASRSPTLLQDILSDIIRLDLLLGTYANEAVLVLAGKKRTIAKLFSKTQFQPGKSPPGSKIILPYRGSRHLLPLGEKPKASLRFAPVPRFRRSLFVRALRPFRNVSVSRLVYVERSGPFPRNAASRDYEVYLWRVKRVSGGQQFVPKGEYAELGLTSNVS
jgi:hypothetical protein